MNLSDHPNAESESRDAAEPSVTPESFPIVEPPTDVQTPTDEPPVVEPSTTDAPATPPGLLYTAKQGETLWGIAKKFGTTIDAIVAANDIRDRNNIRAGQKLIIPR